MSLLQRKVAVVTGASRGIGRVTAARLAQAGATVVVNYATSAEEVGGTRLGELPVPPLTEINLDPQFQAEAITQADFETCWIDAIGKD